MSIPYAEHLIILTPHRATDPDTNTNDPHTWILLYGPSYHPRTPTTEYYTKLTITDSPGGLSCVWFTGTLPSYVMAATYASKRTIHVPETMTVAHDEVKKAISDAVRESKGDKSWLSVLLDTLEFWKWIDAEKKAELEEEIPVEPR